MDAKNRVKLNYIFAVIEKKGFPIIELARRTGIHRATLQRWKAGGEVDPLRLNLVYNYVLKHLGGAR